MSFLLSSLCIMHFIICQITKAFYGGVGPGSFILFDLPIKRLVSPTDEMLTPDMSVVMSVTT